MDEKRKVEKVRVGKTPDIVCQYEKAGVKSEGKNFRIITTREDGPRKENLVCFNSLCIKNKGFGYSGVYSPGFYNREEFNYTPGKRNQSQSYQSRKGFFKFFCKNYQRPQRTGGNQNLSCRMES